MNQWNDFVDTNNEIGIYTPVVSESGAEDGSDDNSTTNTHISETDTYSSISVSDDLNGDLDASVAVSQSDSVSAGSYVTTKPSDDTDSMRNDEDAGDLIDLNELYLIAS